ncbi:MAG: hypothetical protein CFE22_07755 [Cytophagaceae bacterium BCCC1]|nr:MAG: hypothetical protein CFE22_07755 [Cytophagaceae bacterium BCCC1]
MFGQSVTIVPSNVLNVESQKIKKNGIGLDHRGIDGIIGVGTYSGGYLQTHTNHPLYFATNNGSAQMTLATNGRLGIGILPPDAQLDVVRGNGTSGTAAFRGSQWVSHFNYFTDEDTYIRGGKDGSNVYINDLPTLGNVGVGTDNPLDKLHVIGNVRISSLAGSGTRNVYVNSNGTLLPNAISYYSIPNISFTESTNSVNFIKSDVQTLYTDAAYHEVYAPLNLPHGATITDFAMKYLDQSSNTLTFSLIIGNINGSVPTTIALGTSTNALQGTTNTTGLSVNIDNFNHTYLVKITGNWDNANLRIFGALLRYSI